MRGKVLVIEANLLILSTVKWAVETAGYEVVSAADGESGLQQFNSCRPDLVILDLMLPRLDGWEVCRQIRQVSKAPIIIHTALESPDYRVQAANLEACDYLVKPVLPKTIRNRVEMRLKPQEQEALPGLKPLPVLGSSELKVVEYV